MLPDGIINGLCDGFIHHGQASFLFISHKALPGRAWTVRL